MNTYHIYHATGFHIHDILESYYLNTSNIKKSNPPPCKCRNKLRHLPQQKPAHISYKNPLMEKRRKNAGKNNEFLKKKTGTQQ